MKTKNFELLQWLERRTKRRMAKFRQRGVLTDKDLTIIRKEFGGKNYHSLIVNELVSPEK